MRVCSVVGVRPEFVMATPVVRELAAAGHDTTLVHTGQHHDDALSTVFFEELALPTPDHSLGVGSAARDEQIAVGTVRLTPILESEDPDAVLAYGDTTSTLVGALAARATGTPLAHVEAGLRSGDRRMSEERTRVLVDYVAGLNLAPTADAVATLEAEGVTEGVARVGDVRGDAVAMARPLSAPTPGVPPEFVLATVHRAETVDDATTLQNVLAGLADASLPVVLPLHPRTADRLHECGLYDWAAERLSIVEPTGYATFLRLLEDAAAVATDSGGIQREASYLGTPCVTLRETTEWTGTIERGHNTLARTDRRSVRSAVDDAVDEDGRNAAPPTGAAAAVVDAVEAWRPDRSDPETPPLVGGR